LLRLQPNKKDGGWVRTTWALPTEDHLSSRFKTTGVRLGVLIQLREKDGKPIGAHGLKYLLHKGQDPEQLFERSRQIRDQPAKQLADLHALFRK
jgi:hypothetical protein